MDVSLLSERYFKMEFKTENNKTVPFKNCSREDFLTAPEVYDIKTGNGSWKNLICIEDWRNLNIPHESSSLYAAEKSFVSAIQFVEKNPFEYCEAELLPNYLDRYGIEATEFNETFLIAAAKKNPVGLGNDRTKEQAESWVRKLQRDTDALKKSISYCILGHQQAMKGYSKRLNIVVNSLQKDHSKEVFAFQAPSRGQMLYQPITV